MVSRTLRAFLLLCLALVGVAVILMETTIPPEIMEKTGMDRETILLVSFANNVFLIGIAVLIGALTAHRVGLQSLIAHRVDGAGAKLRAFPVYAVLGVLFGLAIAFADQWAFSTIDALRALAEQEGAALASTSQSPEVRFLYGGITEEVMLRWGLMSLIAWLVWAPTKNRMLSLFIAVPVAAILFGVGHLPAIYQALDVVPIEMVWRIIILNASLGIVYGIAYARNSLEAGMVAHAATHVGLLIMA